MPLSEREDIRRLAGEQLTVGPDLERVRVDIDSWQRVVEDEISFPDRSAAAYRHEAARQTGQRTGLDAGLADEVNAARLARAAEGSEHRSCDDRLRRRNRRIAVAHHRAGHETAFDHELRLHAEERRLPEDKIRQLADLDRANLVRDSVREGRIDRVLRDVAADAEVIAPRHLTG